LNHRRSQLETRLIGTAAGLAPGATGTNASGSRSSASGPTDRWRSESRERLQPDDRAGGRRHQTATTSKLNAPRPPAGAKKICHSTRAVSSAQTTHIGRQGRRCPWAPRYPSAFLRVGRAVAHRAAHCSRQGTGALGSAAASSQRSRYTGRGSALHRKRRTSGRMAPGRPGRRASTSRERSCQRGLRTDTAA